MIAFVHDNKKRWGVEPICEQLPIAPSTYYAARNRPPSKRRVRDEELKPEIRRVWDDNYRVYGADKVWAQLNREGTRVARCTTERLMRQLGIHGAIRGKAPHHDAGRRFRSPAPRPRRAQIQRARAEPFVGL